MNIKDIISGISSIRSKANEFIISELKKAGITDIAPSHGFILYTLYKKDGIPMKEITEKINKKKNTVTILINKLIRNGYIYKKADINDKRISRIFLSEKGISFKSDFMNISDKLINKAFKNFKEIEKKELARLLDK